MDKNAFIKDFIIDGTSNYLRNVSIDNVIFGYHEKELKVLLQKPQDMSKWHLQGGYIKRSESIFEAAKRIAREQTGLEDLFLKQFKAFGTPQRTKDPYFTPQLLSRITGQKIEEDHWLFDYFVTIGFYTLTEYSRVKPVSGFYMDECQWWDIHDLPPLLFDHELVIDEALKALRMRCYNYPIGLELLPEKFTLPEFRVLYETILEERLDSRNFEKKLKRIGIIKRLNEKKDIGPHRAPYLYTFNKELYLKALDEGLALVS